MQKYVSDSLSNLNEESLGSCWSRFLKNMWLESEIITQHNIENWKKERKIEERLETEKIK